MRYFRNYIYAGPYLHILEHPSPAKGKNLFRPPRKAETSQKQKALNDRYAAKKMAYLILCNFEAGRDMFVTLTHEKQVSEKAAKAAIRKALGEFRKYFRGQGQEWKYILVNEKQSRWHHHLILPEIPVSVLREIWKENGSDIDYSPLKRYDNYKGLTEYLICEDKTRRGEAGGRRRKKPRKKGQRRYSTSRNLKKPVIIEKEIKRISKGEPHPPKGYKLQDWNKWCDDMGYMHAEYGCIWCGAGPPPQGQQKGGGHPAGKKKRQHSN